jgi:hypothetical protein
MAQIRMREENGKQVKTQAVTLYIHEKAHENARKIAFERTTPERTTSVSEVLVEILEDKLTSRKGV